MQVDFETFITGASNNLKIAIDEVIGAITSIHQDVEKLKVKTSKPDKTTAQGLLEYIAMENSSAKTAMEGICGKEIHQYLKWLDSYCKENGCNQEQALNSIIEGEILLHKDLNLEKKRVIDVLIINNTRINSL